MFALIHPLLSDEEKKDTSFMTIDHVGFEDTIINHLLYLKTDDNQ